MARSWPGVRNHSSMPAERGGSEPSVMAATPAFLNGRGASLLDGYMEDLATDRIYRLMIAQRMRHNTHVPVTDEAGNTVVHTRELVSRLFDEELEKLVANPGRDLGTVETFREARRISETMILNEEFDPV